MKDKRIASIQRGDMLETGLYVLLMLLLLAFMIMTADGGNMGHMVVSIVIAMGGIRIRGEIRKARIDAMRRENVERAERAGLAMPEMYEDVRDIREAVQKSNEKHSKPATVSTTTMCPSCSYKMTIPGTYSQSNAKCGSCGHVYKL